MKMKKSRTIFEKDLIFEDDDRRVDFKLSPEIKSKRNFHESDFLLAWLLSLSKGFNKALLEIRKQVGLKQPIKYPKDPTVNKLSKLIVLSFDSKRYQYFDSLVENLSRKYQLTENWYLSLRIAVLTNTLLVPPSEEPIFVHIPKVIRKSNEKAEIKKTQKPKTIKDLLNQLNQDLIETRRLIYEMTVVQKYPGIYFTRQVTINELKEWISKNRNLLRAIQYGLPKRRIIKRQKKTLFWGQAVWILKQEGIKSWVKIEKELEKILESSKEYLEDEDFASVPITSELQKYYNYFLESLRNLENQ